MDAVNHTVYDCTSIAQRTAGLKHAARALAADACVVLPTDTVYGIGANAFSARGVATLLIGAQQGLVGSQRQGPRRYLDADQPIAGGDGFASAEMRP